MIGIIGGYGNIGIEAADIIKTNSSEMIRVAGRNISKVSQRAKELFASDKWFQIKESSSNEWKDFIKGCRLVLCSAELGNETVECINRIAGELDCPIVYLGINLPKQEAEGKFIYGAGSIPGLSGIIPQYLAQDFDSVASIDFYYGAKGTFTYTAAKDYMDGVFNNSNRSMVMWKYGKLEGKSDAEKIEYSYAEYIQNISNQKNSESYEEDKAYWLNKIDSLSSYPQIPMKMKLADCRDYNIVRKSAIIDSVLWGNFKETARRHKVSPSALLCTLYGRTMAKWGNQSEVLLNLTVFQRQQKNTGKIIGDFTKLLPLNLVFAKEDIWKSAEMVQEQIMKDLDHLSFDGTEIMRELAKRRGVFGKALLPVVFTCVLFDCPENYFERLGSIKYAVSQTPQVFLDNQITEMGGRLHISWDVVDELFEACIIDEIFLEFVEDIKRISENNKANSTNDFVTKVWGNILTKEIITKSVVPDLLKSIDLKQIKILDYAQELCPPDVKGQVYVSESEIMNDRNKTYYKILEHPLYGRMADTGIIGVLTHDGYMEFVVPNCETSVETPDKKEDTHEEEIEKPIVKEIMKIWKEVFEIEDISIQDDFYTLGGDSIILMRLVDEMCKTLGCDVTVDDILQSENISDLANRV